MKHLWEFKSSTATTNRKTIKENDDVFFKMMNKVRGKETLNKRAYWRKTNQQSRN